MDENTTVNHMLIINGLEIPAPSKFNITYNDLDSEETGRSIDGNLHRDVIGTNFRTIDLEWKTMERDALKRLLKALSNKTFSVTYYDPIMDDKVTKTMYAGNRKVDMYNYIIDNGKPLWIDISVSLIQVYNDNSKAGE
jgi:hypothetical protein